jgi:predicted transcriptional regulator
MNVESILRLKGTEVTTIAPEATVKRAADWLRAKNIGSLVVTSGNSILGVIWRTRDRSRAISIRRASGFDDCKRHYEARLGHSGS